MVTLYEVREDATGALYIHELEAQEGFSDFLADYYPNTPTHATPEAAINIYIANQEQVRASCQLRIARAVMLRDLLARTK